MKFVTYRLEKIVNIQEKIMYILFNLLYNRISILIIAKISCEMYIR